mmetsp:Transcript_32708/g.82997  ORF Transcript_32708/g.82997 Transcript_32708/m.82997 type:complete len:242 (+) Transcript_32708:68-793(+)
MSPLEQDALSIARSATQSVVAPPAPGTEDDIEVARGEADIDASIEVSHQEPPRRWREALRRLVFPCVGRLRAQPEANPARQPVPMGWARVLRGLRHELGGLGLFMVGMFLIWALFFMVAGMASWFNLGWTMTLGVAVMVVATYLAGLYFFCWSRRRSPSKRCEITDFQILCPAIVLGSSTKDEDDVCAICLEPKVEGQECRILRCLHGFHKQCIDTWWLQDSGNSLKCALCRQKGVGCYAI